MLKRNFELQNFMESGPRFLLNNFGKTKNIVMEYVANIHVYLFSPNFSFSCALQ